MSEVANDLRKKEVKDAEPLATSLYTGGAIRIVPLHIAGPDGGEVGVSHEYIGIGPLLVPCTRGEQKAKSGDVLVEVIKPSEADPTVDDVFLFLLPREVAEVLKTELTTDPPVTQAAYQKFLDERATRKAKMVVSSTLVSNPKSSALLGSGSGSSSVSKSPAPTKSN